MIRLSGKWLGIAVMIAAPVYAQPHIDMIQNNYGWTLPGLPNYGIAQGAIFAIIGSNLGPTDLVQTAAYPMQTTLSGVSVQANVGGQSLPVPLYYVWNKAVAGVLPSTTPVGDGTLTLTCNGQTATAPLHVVAHAFGILTTNGGGWGTVVAQNLTQGGSPLSLAGYGNTVSAGETLILYGSGLGASRNDKALQNEIVNWNDAIPVELWIGGQKVRPDYAGRSGHFPGLDQINLRVPAGLQGCEVSLYVKMGTGASSNVSNVVTLPMGSGTNRTCSDPGGLQSSDIEALKSGSFGLGTVSLRRRYTPDALNGQDGRATFSQFTPQTASTLQNPFAFASIGSCIVITGPELIGPAPGAGLDAGPQVLVHGPNGDNTLGLVATGNYYGSFPTSGNAGVGPAAYTITGTGGKQVGVFSLKLNDPAALTWTNQNDVTTVQRASDLTVSWTGGDPASNVIILGTSTVYRNIGTSIPTTFESASAEFRCTARNSPTGGQFTVPSGVLMSLPASASNPAAQTGFLLLGNVSTPVRLTNVSGLDVLYGSAWTLTGKAVIYQ